MGCLFSFCNNPFLVKNYNRKRSCMKCPSLARALVPDPSITSEILVFIISTTFYHFRSISSHSFTLCTSSVLLYTLYWSISIVAHHSHFIIHLNIPSHHLIGSHLLTVSTNFFLIVADTVIVGTTFGHSTFDRFSSLFCDEFFVRINWTFVA